MAFNYPLRYGHVTNKRLTIIKIAVVWIVSFCIAGPLFVLSMLDSRQSLHHYKGKNVVRRPILRHLTFDYGQDWLRFESRTAGLFASILQQVANLLRAQVNSASYPQRDR